MDTKYVPVISSQERHPPIKSRKPSSNFVHNKTQKWMQFYLATQPSSPLSYKKQLVKNPLGTLTLCSSFCTKNCKHTPSWQQNTMQEKVSQNVNTQGLNVSVSGCNDIENAGYLYFSL